MSYVEQDAQKAFDIYSKYIEGLVKKATEIGLSEFDEAMLQIGAGYIKFAADVLDVEVSNEVYTNTKTLLGWPWLY